jgi:preprotein translocase SecE subunit
LNAALFLFQRPTAGPEKDAYSVSTVDLQEPEERKPLTWLARVTAFLKEVRHELKMVSFPTWPEVRASALTVLLVIFLLYAFVFLVDQLCERYLEPLMFRH